MAQPAIQTSFASGEWAPKLRSRVDIQKYKVGASLLRNFYVDWAGGGASTRQGTQYINTVGASGARLVPFQPSANVSYVIEFGGGYIRFYSNGATILSGGIPYQITSPYAVSDLFPNEVTGNPGIKWVQLINQLIICHPNYAPQILTIIAPTNWTLTTINFGTTVPTPTGLTLATSLAALVNGWSYSYTVTAVDVNGQESAVAAPATITGFQGLWDSTHLGTNLLTWTAVSGAVSYNVYKAEPVFNSTIQGGAQYGFVANVTGTGFTDVFPGISPDFAQTPPVIESPFVGAGVVSYNVTGAGSYAPGANVPTVTVAASPIGATATAQASVGVTTPSTLFGQVGVALVGDTYLDATHGYSFQVLTVVGPNINTFATTNPGSWTAGTLPSSLSLTNTRPGSASGVGLNLTAFGVFAVNSVSQGAGYTSVPGVTFSGGGATATAVLGPLSAGYPGVPAFLQERLVFGGQLKNVQSFNMSQPNAFYNFNTNFPVEADSAISGNIIADDLNNIRSMVPVPTGLITLTGKSAWLLNGGGGISAMNPVTPSTITAIPQAFNGANDIRPLKMNMDVLYVTNKGNYVRDLTYNIYMNIFTGQDITTLSNHLFFGFSIVDWAWAEEPFKTLWAIRNDGVLLSLGYVREQELMGWAHHDTNGQFKSVASVIETTTTGNTVDAVYFIVERVINGSVVQYVERMADRYFPFGYEDSWSVDAALQTAPFIAGSSIVSITGNASAVGNVVTLTDTFATPFTAPMAAGNYIVRVAGGIYKITGFTSTSVVTATVVRVPTQINLYTGAAFKFTGYYAIWQPVTSVTNLTHLKNTAVTGVADGQIISGTVDNTGALALGGTFTKVTLGLPFTPQLQCLPLDLGEPTVQGKRKKITALTLRVADTLGLWAGTTFANIVPMKDFTLGSIPSNSTGASVISDLVAGDGRTIIDQAWQELGNYCIQQNLPYPATIIGVMPEVIVGDTK